MRLRSSKWWRPSPHQYVEHGGELVTRHPFDLHSTRLYVFPVRADLERLMLLCDRTFAAPTAGAEWYVPIAGIVLISFADITVVRSSDLPDRTLGISTEHEACVWLPILDRRRNRLVWTMPYLFVDEPGPLVGGRETFGYPKQLGTVTFTQDSQGPISFELRARCIQHFAPESKVAEHRVMQIRRSATPGQVPPSTPTRDHPALVIEEIVRSQQPRRPTNLGKDMLSRESAFIADEQARAAVLLLNDVATGSVPVVLLKQFRDTVDPRRACYQAVIEVIHRVTGFRRGGLLGGEWKVETADLDGEPLIRDLGLAPTAVAGSSFWLDFDFRIHSGPPLWEART